MAITGPVVVRAAEDLEYFENYNKYVKLFDEIFMRRR